MSIKKVIDEGYCIGCGACNVADNENIKISFKEGMYKAKIVGEVSDKVSKVCPFSDDASNENELAKFDDSKNYHRHIGNYSKLLAAKVSNDTKRENSSSGGLLTYTLEKLFENDEIDRVLHVKSNDDGYGFEYSESKTLCDITSRTKSRYFPVSLQQISEKLKNQDNSRTAITGVPCFIKSISLLEKENHISPIKFKLALFCGHYKTAHYGELLSWNSGVNPQEIDSVDFRVKNNGNTAVDYYIGVDDKLGEKHLGRVSRMFGSNWGHGFFKPMACEFCDDICGETADATYGDAWLKEFMSDPLGTNVVVTRNKIIDDIVEKGLNKKELWTKPLSVDDVFDTQAANFRHRRGGALHRKDIIKTWTPKIRKDVCEEHKASKSSIVYKKRLMLSKESILVMEKAKKLNSLVYFKVVMLPKVFSYEISNLGFKKGVVATLKATYKAFF